MSALLQVHAHDRVAGIEQGEEDGQVGIGTGVGLHIGVLSAEELLGALACNLFHDVDMYAAAVVALVRIAFSILVGQDGACGHQNGRADDVFGCDQLDVLPLALKLKGACAGHFRVELHQLINGVHQLSPPK